MDWVFTGDLLEAMMKALPVTLSLTAISFTLALVLAILIAVVEYFKVPILDRIFSLYVSFFRGTPLIPQLFLLYFGIPTFVPALRNVSAYSVCVVGLTLNSAAYMKEVVRGSLLSVPEGQKEAALAHGMSSMQTMFRIVLPQAARVAIPSLFNNLVDIVKGTSMAFTIGVIEITAAANLRAAVTFNYFEAYMVLMLLYWVIILILERFETVIEKYFEKNNCLPSPSDDFGYKTKINFGTWASKQRTNYHNGELTNTQIQELESLGFIFDLESEKELIWNEKCNKLKNWLDTHNNIYPNDLYSNDKEEAMLASFVSYNRNWYWGKLKKYGEYPKERKIKLDAIGFDWGSNAKTETLLIKWNKNYEEVKKQLVELGSIPFLINKKNNPLYTWLAGQRTAYKNGKLSDDKIKKLKELNLL